MGVHLFSYLLILNMYLGAFLRSIHAHHVVSAELLKELHLGDAEVEIQTAGHVHLQRVATHHYLLDGLGRQYKRGGGVGGGGEKREARGRSRKIIQNSKQHWDCL